MNPVRGAIDPGGVRRIVVRSVNWLGDAVMTTPALQRLRERFPDAEIVLLTPAKLADLWTQHPAIDRIVDLDAREGLWKTARRIRNYHADLGIIFPNSARTALEFWLARIPHRLGTATPGRRWLLNHAIERDSAAIRMRKRTPSEVSALVAGRMTPSPKPGPEAHQLHHYLRLVAALGASPIPLAPFLRVSQNERTAARQTLATNWPGKLPSGWESGWLGINPGAEYGPAKRWPAEYFGNTVEILRAGGHQIPFVIFGGAADSGAAATVVRTACSPCANLAGKTRLRELMALLAECRVLLTNDTGPMHVAAALGVPVVVPFGSTSPELTGPGLSGDPRHRLLRSAAPCAPCFLPECPINLRCLRGINPNSVASALTELLPPPR